MNNEDQRASVAIWVENKTNREERAFKIKSRHQAVKAGLTRGCQASQVNWLAEWSLSVQGVGRDKGMINNLLMEGSPLAGRPATVL
ncbi:hypothetical protein [Peribacillus kribbensis]|uniref:hypothetical protein n=1 Tax=Peribacillus kribbensis TaxID=356658 RepID=UPI000478D179|nr:hypothetical protein [Peribacillus kribbensis]